MSNSNTVHIALLPSAGMGHLAPFLRLAATLITHNCQITFITPHSTVSNAESQLLSRFLAAFPQITTKQFRPLPLDPSTANSKNPIFLQFETIRRSAHLLSPLLSSSSPPLSALVTDVMLASAFIPVSVTSALGLPNYLLFTSSAGMLALCACFPNVDVSSSDEIQIPDSSAIPKSWIPPLLLNPTSFFITQFVENGQALVESDGILINTFDGFEQELLASLNDGKVVKGLPPVISIGPLVPCDFERGGDPGLELSWLDDQPDGSVIYVSFGSRTALSREQIKELGYGLVRSGCRFLWVVKDKKVDKEDEERVEEVLGSELVDKVKEKGLVVKSWVDQERILSHSAVGAFLTHCGWNSVTEAAWHGVPMLVWPQGGDQRINANVVETSGLGKWARNWNWGRQGIVMAEEIGEKVKEMMGDAELKATTARVKEEARKAVSSGGSSEIGLTEWLRGWMEPSSYLI